MKTIMRRCAAIVLGLTLGLTAWAGLETVTHIQDLNTSWPLGSDLASTSDDHIRNIKSALKTDFPNFNGTYTSASLPVFAIPSDTNTGMYSVAADDLGFSTGGTLRFDISTTAFTGTLPWRGQDGSSAAPAFSFSGDTDTGIYRVAANDVAMVTGGTIRGEWTATTFVSSLPILNQSGTAGAPAYTFSSDSLTGTYLLSSSQLGFTTAGTRRGYFFNSGFVVEVATRASDGSSGSPGYTFDNDADTGFYRDTNNQIGIALGGSTAGQIAQGTYTATITGCTTSPTVTVTYQRVGKMVMLEIPTITCTSNTSQFTLTGAPAVITPSSTTGTSNAPDTQDSGTRLFSSTVTLGSTGILVFSTGGNSSGWTASGVKGIPVATQIQFLLN